MNTYSSAAQRLKKIDWHTWLFVKLIRQAVKRWNADLPTFENIEHPKWSGELPSTTLPFTYGENLIHLPTKDEDWPAADLSRRAALAFLRNGVTFPVTDLPEPWTSLEEARATFQELLPMGGMMKRPYHVWEDVTSDAAMSRLAFAGLGALRLVAYQPADGDPEEMRSAKWVSNMSYMYAYEVREGLERYGATAWFDAEQRLMGIYWCHGQKLVKPGEADWEHAKWAWRCTLMVGTTVTDHLVGVHWLVGNYVVTAARTRLGVDHYLRKLLKPFTWRTVTINANASDSLLPQRGFVHRAAGLTYESLTRSFRDSIGLMGFTTVPDMVAAKKAEGMGNAFPWATDALALYEVVHAFVDEYLSAYASEEDILSDKEIDGFWDYIESAPAAANFPSRSRKALVDILAQFIWSVTGYHEAAGTVHEYVLDPAFMGTKIRPGTEVGDVQASLQFFLILALTGLSMPGLLSMGDAKHLFGDDMRGREVFQRFHDRLVVLSETIDAANKERAADPDRPWPCQTFNPRVLETAVSI